MASLFVLSRFFRVSKNTWGEVIENGRTTGLLLRTTSFKGTRIFFLMGEGLNVSNSNAITYTSFE